MAAPVEEKPTNEQVLEAIDVLRRAGLNISVSPTLSEVSVKDSSASTNVQNTPPLRPANPSEYINQDYQTINMMLGNGNNNNNDPMMNMLPYMLQQNSDGKNLDPHVIHALMMNSMMNGISDLNSTDNK